ncbi:hypothetical protein P4O66_004804, partial [Electrophorus voltai]
MMIHSGPNISMFTDVLGQPSNTADHSVLPELEDIPKSLWATHDNNVGFIDCPPYKARLKHGTPVYCKQYPLSPDLHKRFTQDLRRINDIVVPITPLVPDVSAILTAIPAHHHFFTVEDICSLYQSTQTANHFSHLRFRVGNTRGAISPRASWTPWLCSSLLSAQVAELMALTSACHLFRDQVVTICTDSRHAFGVAHDF